MGKALRFAGYGVLALLGLALLAGVLIYGVTEYQLRRTISPEARAIPSATAASLSEGHRLADVLGCTGCHRDDLQGQKFFAEPGVATVYATNLTRLLQSYNDQELEAAIRQGVRRDGTTLLGMPSSTFARLKDEDLAKVIRFLRTFEPAGEETPAPSIGPLGRLGLVLGQFKSEVANVAEAKLREPMFVGRAHDRGRYIATITCAECHHFDLGGAEGRIPDLALAGAYDSAQFEKLMRTGEGAGKRDLGMMSGVARSRYSRFTPDELKALHAYLIARAQNAPAGSE